MAIRDNFVINGPNPSSITNVSILSGLTSNLLKEISGGGNKGIVLDTGSNMIIGKSIAGDIDFIFQYSGLSSVQLGSFIGPDEGVSSSINDLTIDTSGNLISVMNTGSIYHHSGISNVILGSFKPDEPNPRGIHYHGKTGEMLHTSSSFDYVYRYDGFSSASGADLLGSFATSYPEPDYITQDKNNNLVIHSGSNDFIYQHSGISATLLGSFLSPTENTGNIMEGIAHNPVIAQYTPTDNLPTIITELTVNGSPYNDYRAAYVRVNNNNYNSASNFQATFDSPFGRHATDFSVGNEVIIKGDETTDKVYEHLDNSGGTSNFLGGAQWFSQTFTIGAVGDDVAHVLKRIKIYTGKEGSPGDMSVSIRETDDSGAPKDLEIASGTLTEPVSDDIDEYSIEILTGNGEFLYLQQGTKYAFVFSAPAGTPSTDRYNLRGETIFGGDSLYAGGNQYTSNDSGDSWSGNLSSDIFFKEEGQAIRAQTKLIVSPLERVNKRGRGTRQDLIISGRDYSQRLYDITVEPVVYTDSEISTIVTNIISNNISDITTNNVNVTETTLQRITFNHLPVADALTELAQRAGFFWYVDNDKDLHFKQLEAVDSGIIFDNTNINASNLNETREGMFNSVYIYGGRQLAGYEERFTADGVGSVFTLESKPRNTYITNNGSVQRGGVFELVVTPVSGPNYLVSFHDKQIIFVSGTDLGYNSIPQNGSIVVVQYDRDIPIVKAGANRESIQLYGKKEKVINDKTIEDPNTATELLKTQLENVDPFKGVNLDVTGWYNLTPGDTARVTLSDFDIDEEIGILSAEYDFTQRKINQNQVVNIKLDKKVNDLTDEIKNLSRRLTAIEETDKQDTDFLTRFEFADNQFSVVGSYWSIGQATLTGSGFGLYSTGFTPTYPLKVATLPQNISGARVYYNFEQGSGTTEADQVVGAIGSFISGASYAQGYIGSGLLCNGSDSYFQSDEIGSIIPGPAPGSSFTISAWINTIGSSLGLSGPAQSIVSTAVGDNTSFTIDKRDGGAPGALNLRLDDSQLQTQLNLVESNKWNHVVATVSMEDLGAPYYWNANIWYNGSVYADTQNTGSKQYSTGTPDGTARPAYIGFDSRFKFCFNGYIDEVSIYDKRLGSDAIRQLFYDGVGRLAGSFTGSAQIISDFQIIKSGGFF